MSGSENNKKTFARRAFFVAALQGAFLAVLGGRLAWLQVAEGQRYKTLADKNRINIKILPPSRGLVFDRAGELLATNKQNFQVMLIPEQTDNIELVLNKLQKLIKLTNQDIERVIKEASKSAKFIPLEVKDNLDWKEVSTVEVNLPDLPGLFINIGELRHYPLEEATAHLIGYVGAVDKTELTGEPLLEMPSFKIGKTGIEKKFDKPLRGKPGASEVEVNVSGREVRQLRQIEDRPGLDIDLTIDAHLQTHTQERLKKEKSASAIIMDANNGQIYSMASSPSFNPNEFIQGLSVDAWEGLLADPGLPLNNKAISGQYPPGSTFKLVTALAGLELGVINKNTKVYCKGYYEYAGDRFHCWNQGGHGTMDLIDAMSESCDTFFYDVATEIGINKLSETAQKLGLGQRYDLGLPGERPGLMPDKNWKMGHFGEHWKIGETIVASIGQGYIQTTPLQLAIMTARVINGGFEVSPSLIMNPDNKDIKFDDLGYKKDHLMMIKRGLIKAVNNSKGTAYGSRISQPGFQMGGKTGTAQVKRITMKQRREGIRNESLPWKYRHHALFVGYAPIKNPRYVCSVVVEHGVGGAISAAPLARDLLLETQKRKPETLSNANKQASL